MGLICGTNHVAAPNMSPPQLVLWVEQVPGFGFYAFLRGQTIRMCFCIPLSQYIKNWDVNSQRSEHLKLFGGSGEVFHEPRACVWM